MQSSENFRSRQFLLHHIQHTLSFYEHRVVDPNGGFFHCYMNNGELFSPGLRTLVASCRFVFNYAKAYQTFGKPSDFDKIQHGLAYLRQVHRNPHTGAYAWKIENGQVIDASNHCYGLAFVLLAYACAVKAGVHEAQAWIDETFALMEQYFWCAQHQRYASEADANWKLQAYRGQNDNMHACEALIVAYEATHNERFLERAALLADQFAKDQAALNGHIWEHFSADWQPDLSYNRDDKSNSLRPWGVQTGHQTEWAKLLLILDRHRPESWRLDRAQSLFKTAMRFGWDENFGGLIYGYDLTGQPYDQDKYFWVQAESFAAAALLAVRTQDESYWLWYDKIWQYSFKYFVDHQFGAWYRILSPQNSRYDERKSYANKADYHTMGACYEVLNVVSP